MELGNSENYNSAYETVSVRCNASMKLLTLCQHLVCFQVIRYRTELSPQHSKFKRNHGFYYNAVTSFRTRWIYGRPAFRLPNGVRWVSAKMRNEWQNTAQRNKIRTRTWTVFSMTCRSSQLPRRQIRSLIPTGAVQRIDYHIYYSLCTEHE